MRWVMPRVRGRGAGLGNELIPLARAFLAADMLGAQLLPPAFGLNQRGYGSHFRTSRLDWLYHNLIEKCLPVVEFKESDYLRCGGGDVCDALQKFIQSEGLEQRKHFVLVTEGMWGGLYHLQKAREFVRTRLQSSAFAAENLARLGTMLDTTKVRVGMHVRMGDFNAPSTKDDYRGKFSTSMPLDWFMNIGIQIRESLGEQVEFLLVSDGSDSQLAPLIEVLRPIRPPAGRPSDCSDLLALSQADLLLCSISSYSLWAAFLSDSPYIWFRDQLQSDEEGFLSIWGHESAQQKDGSPTRRAIDDLKAEDQPFFIRGRAMERNEVVPIDLMAHLQRVARTRRHQDLVQYGVLRTGLADFAG